MTTASDLIEKTRREILMGKREQYDVLNGAIIAGANTLIVTDDTDASTGYIQRGVILEIDTELMLVRSRSGTTITVLRGMFGTTDAGHSNGAEISINPRFPRHSILEAINDDLDDLSSPDNGLFQVKVAELTYSAAVRGYNIDSATAIETILRVTFDEPGSAKVWPEIRNYRLRRNAETDDFTSGFAVVLNEGANPGAQLRVEYAAPFTRMSATTDDVQSVAGLPATANDIPVLGAQIRLVSPTEIARNFTRGQSDSRADDDVPPGAKLSSIRGPASIRQARIAAERTRLHRAYPRKIRVG